jgi:hypothetical protein
VKVVGGNADARPSFVIANGREISAGYRMLSYRVVPAFGILFGSGGVETPGIAAHLRPIKLPFALELGHGSHNRLGRLPVEQQSGVPVYDNSAPPPLKRGPGSAGLSLNRRDYESSSPARTGVLASAK